METDAQIADAFRASASTFLSTTEPGFGVLVRTHPETPVKEWRTMRGGHRATLLRHTYPDADTAWIKEA